MDFFDHSGHDRGKIHGVVRQLLERKTPILRQVAKVERNGVKIAGRLAVPLGSIRTSRRDIQKLTREQFYPRFAVVQYGVSIFEDRKIIGRRAQLGSVDPAVFIDQFHNIEMGKIQLLHVLLLLLCRIVLFLCSITHFQIGVNTIY